MNDQQFNDFLRVFRELRSPRKVKCFDEASRLVCWIRDYGDDHPKEFVSDVKVVLMELHPVFKKALERPTNE